ncbi:Gmad2 immunoglobulin-like domain-containing protein, partial [Brevibacillus brevis]
MKKMLLLLLTIGLLQGCTSGTDSPSTPTEQQKPPVATKPETPASEPPATTQPTTPEKPPTKQTGQQETVYGNDIFRNVTVKKTAQDTYEIKGQASVFEAVLNYVVEDGHNELTQ